MKISEKEKERLKELITQAKETFIDNSDWYAVIEMLDKEEQKEYWKLSDKDGEN